jgi:magnesium transporter
MPWYQLDDAKDPKLDELARQYNLHPLHIEDARSADESVNVDTAPNYTFAVFKPVRLDPDPVRSRRTCGCLLQLLFLTQA